ncbi:hypothetical protein Zmor_003995 [Zophobas morio]|uniref:Uncharacterized protein n=1 Tax=Zophobas morio TaxID=2755281 RepID=A0AA38M176_9CUCU|nr:hypothetical protein Zmor_003995 [Zophobas morio]
MKYLACIARRVGVKAENHVEYQLSVDGMVTVQPQPPLERCVLIETTQMCFRGLTEHLMCLGDPREPYAGKGLLQHRELRHPWIT